MESPQRQKGLRMTIQLVRKPPIGKMNGERLKIVLAGSHTMKQKACMLMQVKFWLHQEHGIDNADHHEPHPRSIDLDDLRKEGILPRLP
jgi:hypothetical protein